MRNSKSRSDETARITIRVPASTLKLIEQAAAVHGKSRNDFILESARLRASLVLLDQGVFKLDPRQSEAFEETLANPPKANHPLRELMRSKTPWA